MNFTTRPKKCAKFPTPKENIMCIIQNQFLNYLVYVECIYPRQFQQKKQDVKKITKTIVFNKFGTAQFLYY